MKFITCLFVAQVLICISFVDSVSFHKDVAVTMEQKMAIDKLRKRVLPYIVENYMKQDLHLLRFLRSTNFDLDRTEKKILEDIRWRNETRMVTIEQEDFSDLLIDYPFVRGGQDKEGRPVFIAMASEWNVRAGILTGKGKRMLRYAERELELVARQIRKLQSEGKNITQGVLIIDLDHWSIVTHACVQCIAVTLDLLIDLESHFPGMADKIIFLNAPATVGFAMDIFRQNVSKETNQAIRVYGTNKQKWRKILLEWIDKKYLPVELGGTLERHQD